MEESLKKYWKIYSEFYSNEKMVHKNHNPLREYEEEFVDGPILELGSGQSSFLVEFSKNGREIFAVDNENFQLHALNKRIAECSTPASGKVHLLNLTIPRDKLPEKKFSIVIMSDFLHFFTMKDCKALISEINERTIKGSLIYVRAHSKKHSYNNSSYPAISEYFKHFFSQQDLDILFNRTDFECLTCSENKQYVKSKYEHTMEVEWISGLLDDEDITDPEEREKAIHKSTSEIVNAWVACIYRRK
jgi:hypothetical protein